MQSSWCPAVAILQLRSGHDYVLITRDDRDFVCIGYGEVVLTLFNAIIMSDEYGSDLIRYLKWIGTV